MTDLLFYRQKRVDGGLRSGIDLNGSPLAEGFREGDEEPNPVLLWYIDLRCSGEHLPHDADKAIEWFRENNDAFTGTLRRTAQELSRTGVDTEALPFRQQFRNLLPGVNVDLVISTLGRPEGRDVAQFLREFADDWLAQLDGLALSADV
ncbi:MAG: hypothetical protein WDZ59_12750 [Pirellulales bacterium]